MINEEFKVGDLIAYGGGNQKQIYIIIEKYILNKEIIYNVYNIMKNKKLKHFPVEYVKAHFAKI